jgi:hypothetical protein
LKGEFTMEEIRISEYYVIKVSDEQASVLPREGWSLFIDNNYQKTITHNGVTIQEHLGLKSEILRFVNGDDLDFRPENLVLEPVVEEVPEIVEEEVYEVELPVEEEVFEEEPEVVLEDELLED